MAGSGGPCITHDTEEDSDQFSSPMIQEHKHKLQTHFGEIVSNLGRDNSGREVVGYLVDTQILDEDEQQMIQRSDRTPRESIRTLLQMLQRKSEAAYCKFLEALKDYVPILYNKLRDKDMPECPNRHLPKPFHDYAEGLKRQNINTHKILVEENHEHIPVKVHRHMPGTNCPMSTEHPIEIPHILSVGVETNENETRKRVLVAGPPGVGKSEMCYFIIQQQSQGFLWNEDIDFVYFIPWKEVNMFQESVSFQDLLFRYFGPSIEHDKEKELMNYIKDNQSRVLFIIDGFEKYGQKEQMPLRSLDAKGNIKALLHNLICGNILPQSHVLLTSRSYMLDQRETVANMQILHHRGFDEDKVERMIDCKLNIQSYPQINKKLKEHLRDHPNIASLCSCPVHIQGLLSSLVDGIKDNPKLPESKAALYLILLINMLKNHSHKGEKSLPAEDILSKHSNFVVPLSALAFEGCFVQNKQRFNKQDLQRHGLEPEELEKSGLMVQDDILRQDVLPLGQVNERGWRFPDYIFQEFFSTLRLCKSDLKGILDIIDSNEGQHDAIILLVMGMLGDPSCQHCLFPETPIEEFTVTLKILLRAVFSCTRRFHRYGQVFCMTALAESQPFRHGSDLYKCLLRELSTPLNSLSLWETNISSSESDQLVPYLRHVVMRTEIGSPVETQYGEVLVASTKIDASRITMLLRSGCPGISIVGQYTSETMYDIAQALSENSTLERLAFWGVGSSPCTSENWKFFKVKENSTLKCWGLAFGMIDSKEAFGRICERVSMFRGLDTFSIIMTSLTNCLRSLKHLANICYLILHDCSLKSTDMLDVANFVHANKSDLAFLDLSKNRFGDEGAHILASCFKEAEALKVLNVGQCDLSNQAVTYVLQGLKGHGAVQKIKLYENEFGEEAIQALNECLNHGHTVTELSMKGCKLVGNASDHLANCLKQNKSLKVLDISQLKGDNSAGLTRIIPKVISSNADLQALLVSQANITDDIIDGIAISVQNRGSLLLDISGNRISAEAVNNLLSTRKVEHIAIHDLSLDHKEWRALGVAMSRSTVLKSCMVGYNDMKGLADDGSKEAKISSFLDTILDHPPNRSLETILICGGRKNLLARKLCEFKQKLPNISVDYVIGIEPFLMLSDRCCQCIPKVRREWLTGTYAGIGVSYL